MVLWIYNKNTWITIELKNKLAFTQEANINKHNDDLQVQVICLQCPMDDNIILSSVRRRIN